MRLRTRKRDHPLQWAWAVAGASWRIYGVTLICIVKGQPSNVCASDSKIFAEADASG
jgi:hypothetical protein